MVFGVETKTLVIAGGTLALVPCLFGYLADESIPGASGRLLAWLGQRTYSIYLWQQPAHDLQLPPRGVAAGRRWGVHTGCSPVLPLVRAAIPELAATAQSPFRSITKS